MKVLHVIHGYPPYYMAGSEVYTYNLTQELSKDDSIDVSVFTRIENPFEDDYSTFDEKVGNVQVRRINKNRGDYSLEDKYLDKNIDDAFREYVEYINPDIVHIGHLSHLSTNIVNIAKEEYGLPIIFTIHDFWMFCIRGQLLTKNYKLCQGPEIEKCNECLSYLHPSIEDLKKYNNFMDGVLKNIDLFLSPSHYLRDFYIKNGIPENKVIYSKYGFKKELIKFNKKYYTDETNITFGFMGRIIPAKGVHLLLKAYDKMNCKNTRLLIFGNYGKYLPYLEKYTSKEVEFRGGYDNNDINNILSEIDVLVVPSIWYENSPLVIQEAFLAGVPVITTNLGGMKELVKDGVNGFLFNNCDIDDLKSKMEYIASNPSVLNNIKPCRELVRSIEDDAKMSVEYYEGLL